MSRYIPNTQDERQKMLEEIGYSSIEELWGYSKGNQTR